MEEHINTENLNSLNIGEAVYIDTNSIQEYYDVMYNNNGTNVTSPSITTSSVGSISSKYFVYMNKYGDDFFLGHHLDNKNEVEIYDED